jgi:hypothetical protein
MTLQESVRRHLNRRRRPGPGAAASIFLAGAIALAGCSMNDGIGNLIVDPGHYSVYHCKDFQPRLANLTSREQQLRNLMDKASEGSGGAAIGNLAYRAEYEDLMGEERLLRRAAAEKNCELTAPSYQSDQTIR